MSSRRRRILAIALILGLPFVLYMFVWISGGIALRRSEKALRQAGRPMTPTEIIPPAVRYEDNAAPLYKAAYDMLNSGGATTILTLAGNHLPSVVPTLNDFGTNEHVAMFRLALGDTNVVEAFKLIEEGSSKPSYWNDLGYSRGPGLLLPHAAEMRALSRFLRQKARCEALDGKREQAWRTVAAGLRSADAFRHEPVLTSQLVRMAQFGLAVETIQNVVECGLPRSLGHELDVQIAKCEEREPLVLALDGERVLFSEWAFRQNPAVALEFMYVWGPSGATGLSDVLVRGVKYTLGNLWCPVMRRDRAEYNRVVQVITERAAVPFPGRDLTDETLMDTVPRYCIFTRLLAGSLDYTTVNLADLTARSRIVRSGLKIIEFQQETGRLPTTLAEAVSGEAAEDPFTGKPLHYRTEGAGFVLYSVGRDMKDDGGKAQDRSASEPTTWDVVWSFPGLRQGATPQPL
jgi:hypothetical protein